MAIQPIAVALATGVLLVRALRPAGGLNPRRAAVTLELVSATLAGILRTNPNGDFAAAARPSEPGKPQFAHARKAPQKQ